MNAFILPRLRGSTIRNVLLTLGVFIPVAASAAPAIYDVALENSRVLITIDTHGWLAGNMARTAYVHVIYKTSGGEVSRDYDFLKDATTPAYLERGHVYARALPIDVPGVSDIKDSRLRYTFEGKADEFSESAVKGSIGGADVRIKGPVATTWEPKINRNGMDYRHKAVANARECQTMCLQDARCRAFTTGVDGGMCWLKDAVPSAKTCGICVSGVKLD